MSDVIDADAEEIAEFLEYYNKHVEKGKSRKHVEKDKNLVHVNKLRHIIPIFIVVCFNLKEDEPEKKKGQCHLK